MGFGTATDAKELHPMQAADSTARILIAEDTPQAAELLELYLSEAGFDTCIASDGQQAMEMVREYRPDVLLLDVMMPRLSGFEVCKRLRADPTTREIGVIMVTALDQQTDIDRAVEAGTDDFLSKPINKEELFKRVRSLLASRQHRGELERALAYIEGVQKSDASQP
jgi:DNA-binding response OmpR family regulator